MSPRTTVCTLRMGWWGVLVFRSEEGPEGESRAVGGFGAGVAVAGREDAVALVEVEVMENIAVVPRGRGRCVDGLGVVLFWHCCGGLVGILG